ncbi:pogo transposable element [Fusarium beomiforme]|uniref:Pogo transposable element n=1 Tax=Fusarium beomiforme TaxID=44412 RepID=A0A9P5A8N9_9HYPO|nr:pogo transposable element [Fusarium beomiforme]
MALKTFEILLPARTTNHSDPHLLCPPVSWEKVVIFFLGNYVTHAATVKLPPATPLLANIWICLGALLMPATGLVFGLLAFSQAIKGLTKSELTKATVAGALCMYVRTSEWPPDEKTVEVRATRGPHIPSGSVWLSDIITQQFLQMRRASTQCRLKALRPLMGAVAILLVYFALSLKDAELVFHLIRAAKHEAGIEMGPRPLESRTILLTRDTTRPYLSRVSPNANIHGLSYRLPGYELVIVPDDAVIDPITMVDDRAPPAWKKNVHLAKSWNVAKGLVALLQFCFSLFVLIKARGNQIEIYGYAAFSLTVAPYAVMAFVNLLANACIPTYTCLYLVRNDVLTEMEKVLPLRFDGIVGTVRQVVDNNVNLSPMVRSENGSLHMIIQEEGEENIRLEVLRPEKAIAHGIIPSQTVAIEECGEIELEARRPWLYIALL